MTKKMKCALLFISIVSSLAIAALGLEIRTNNRLGWLLFFLGVSVCIAGSLFLAISKYRDSLKVTPSDRSLWIISMGLLAICLVPPLEYLYLPTGLPRTVIMEEIGLILMGAGLLFLFRSRFLLELWDFGDDERMPDRRLTRKGTYQIARYPGYAGLVLIAIGLCIGFSSLFGLLAVVVLLLPGIGYRMQLE